VSLKEDRERAAISEIRKRKTNERTKATRMGGSTRRNSTVLKN
jgi:hypothetical protein